MMNTEIINNLGIPETNEDLDRGVDVAYDDDYRKAKIRELEAKIQQLDENNKKSQDDRDMRRTYAQKAYGFARNTLIGWAVLVFLYVIVPEKSKIMDIQLFGIITSACTVNILVAFHAVIKGLFATK